MDAKRNPFTPGAGSQPPELSGRDNVLEDADVAVARTMTGRNAQGLILVGLRGVGKTVCLNRLWIGAEHAGAKAILLEATENKSLVSALLPQLRRTLISLDLAANAGDKARRGMRVFRSFVAGLKLRTGELEFEFGGVEPERGAADSGDLEADLGQLLGSISEAAQERGTALVLCIDELQNLSQVEFGALIMAAHRASQRNLPFLLLGAGLPQIVALAGRSKSYAERLFRYPEIGPYLRKTHVPLSKSRYRRKTPPSLRRHLRSSWTRLKATRISCRSGAKRHGTPHSDPSSPTLM